MPRNAGGVRYLAILPGLVSSRRRSSDAKLAAV